MKPAWLFKGIALAIVIVLALGSQARATTSSELRNQISALETEGEAIQLEIDRLEGMIRDNAVEIRQIMEQKNAIDQQIALLHEQITNTDQQIAAYQILIAEHQVELAKAEADYAQLYARYKERIRAMEEQHELSYWAVLFRANSFSEFLDSLEMIREISEADSRRLQQLRDAAKAVNAAKTKLEAEKAGLEQTRLEMEKAQQILLEKQTQAELLLQELRSKGREFELLLEESESKQDELMLELAQAESRYDEAIRQEWLATSQPETNTEQQRPKPPVDGTKWLTPVPYYTLTSKFGMRFHPVLNTWRMHNGVDLACAADTPIYASRSGIVAVAAYQEYGAGNYVQLDHGDGYRSIYMHMTRYVVSPGQYVTAGQVIGYVGDTGLSDGNHLHFGISYNGEYIDPMQFIG